MYEECILCLVVRYFGNYFFGLVSMRCVGKNNVNLRETKNMFSQPFLKMWKFLLDMRKDLLIMNKFCIVEILSEANSLTMVASKKILKMSNYLLILSIFS